MAETLGGINWIAHSLSTVICDLCGATVGDSSKWLLLHDLFHNSLVDAIGGRRDA